MPTQEEYATASLESSSASTAEKRGSSTADAAVGLRHVQAEQILLAQLEPHLATELVVGDVLLLVRTKLAVDEGPAGLPERLVIGLEDGPLHRARPSDDGHVDWLLLASRFSLQKTTRVRGTNGRIDCQAWTASTASVMSILSPMSSLPPSSGMLKVTLKSRRSIEVLASAPRRVWP